METRNKPKWHSAIVAAIAGLAIIPIVGAHRPADPPAAYGTLAPGHSTGKKKSKKPEDDDALALLTPGHGADKKKSLKPEEEQDSLNPAQKASLTKAMAAAAQVAPADPTAAKVDSKKWVPALNKAMHDAHITTPDQQAAFLAQIDEESAGLSLINEMPWGLDRSQWDDQAAVKDYFNQKYANMNGNGDVDSGDGYNYRGRGILQITGKTNYAAVSQQIYGDDRLVKHPDLMSQPDVAAEAAAAYWNENDLNRFIPAGQPVTPDEFQDLGSAINTGQPGNVPHNAAERAQYWEAIKEALGVKT